MDFLNHFQPAPSGIDPLVADWIRQMGDGHAEHLRDLVSAMSRLITRGESEPTPVPFSGAFGQATALVKWTKTLDRVSYTVNVTITTNGTAAGYVAVPMPFPAGETTGAAGVDSASTTSALTGFILGSNLFIKKYDGTYPGANGRSLLMSGSYRAVRTV